MYVRHCIAYTALLAAGPRADPGMAAIADGSDSDESWGSHRSLDEPVVDERDIDDGFLVGDDEMTRLLALVEEAFDGEDGGELGREDDVGADESIAAEVAVEVPAELGAGGFPAVPDPPLPPPDAAPGPRALAGRGRAAAVVEADGGWIAFYESKNAFQAVCTNPFHGDCKLTRGATRKAHMRGRPCGMLRWWLDIGAACDSKQEHMDLVATLAADWDDRNSARARIRAHPDGPALLAFERPFGGDSDEEPRL